LIQPFFLLFEKVPQGDYLKFGKALYFYIHPSFRPKNTFQSYSYTFSSIFLMENFNGNGKILAKKDYFYLVKSRH